MTREESTLSTHLERARIHLLELLVESLERELIHIVRNGELLDARLEASDLLLGGLDDVIDGIDLRGLRFTTDEINVDMFGDLNVTLGK